MKKPKTTTTKPAEKVTIEQVVTTEATPVPPATPKKTSTARKSPSKTKAAAAKPVAAETPELAMAERIGLTAGDIWRYLAEQGATPVAILVKELTEEEKIIQRSLGWLAKEDKITLTVIDRVETLALKD